MDDRCKGQYDLNLYDGHDCLFCTHYPLDGMKTVSQFGDGSHTIINSYDGLGQLTQTSAGGRTLRYRYDAAGNVIDVAWPDGFHVSTQYDGFGRPSQFLENGTASLAKYSYDALNRRARVELGNGTRTEFAYDNRGWLSGQDHRFTSSAEDWIARFARNQLGDITRSSVTHNRYGWKPATGTRTTYTANGLNQYRTAAGRAVTYDLNGNLTGDGVWTYSYDLDNRMRTATRRGTNAVLGYDPEGRLIRTTIDGAETSLLYDGQALAAEYDKAGALVRRYVFGPGTDEPLVQYEGAGTASKSWMYANQQGSVVALANSSGATTSSQAYGPFGETDGTLASRFGYTGQQYLAPLGLYYYKARMYSPTLGRFLQTDPIGYKDDLNWYAYVGNNPANLSDPSGLAAQCSQSDIFGQGIAKSDAITPLYPETVFIPAVKIAQTIYNAVNGIAAPAATQEISTGRTVPNSLQEKLAMEQVMAKPQGTTPPRMPKMSDKRNGLMDADGWVKRTQNVNGVEIHYVENIKTGKFLDFKFKD